MKTLSKLASVVEEKKDSLIERIQNSNPWFLFINWLLTNWVTILLVLGLSVFALRNYMQIKDLQETMLKKQIQELNEDLKKAKLEKEKLLGRIEEFEKSIGESIKQTKKIKVDVAKLDSAGKKEKLLMYKNRLIRERGL